MFDWETIRIINSKQPAEKNDEICEYLAIKNVEIVNAIDIGGSENERIIEPNEFGI